MIDINLLPVKNELTQSERSRRRWWLVALAGVSFLFVIALGLIIGIWQGEKNQIASLDTEKSKLMAQFDQNQENAKDVLILKNKVETISQIQKAQFNFMAEIVDLENIFNSSGNFRSLNLNTNGSVILEIDVTDTNTLATLLAALVRSPDSEILSGTSVQGIALTGLGTYPLKVSATYIKNNSPAL